MNDSSLVLTIRVRKYTSEFNFYVGLQKLTVRHVQTEVDAGYEGSNQVVLIEAKNASTKNVIIRQIFYPFRHWSNVTKKRVISLFFEKRGDIYSIWQYEFKNKNNYNSISLTDSIRYRLV